MSIVGKPGAHTVWKRRYRARLLREADPVRFYLRRHIRKAAGRAARKYMPVPPTMADLAALIIEPGEFAFEL
jgi:hypothetical protein